MLTEKITRRRIIVVVVLIGIILAAIVALWPSPGLTISPMSVWRAEDGQWYTTLLISNRLDAELSYVWLESEDRELRDKGAEGLLSYDINLSPSSTIGPHQASTRAARLPPPGMARRFRIRYWPSAQKASWLKSFARRWWPIRKGGPGGRVAVSPEVSTDHTEFEQAPMVPLNPSSSSPPSSLDSVASPGSRVLQLARPSELSAAAGAKNVPVQFWGKVIDQDDTPLAGVKIISRVRHWRRSALYDIDARFISQETVSAADGRLEITGATGDVLTIESLEKEGYEPDRSALRSFGYNISENISPDPSNPIVLRMWQKSIKAELITGRKFFAIIPDGRVYTLDLFTGTKLESAHADGDLRVWVKRPSSIVRGQRYNWSCRLQPINGQLLEEPDPDSSMSLAPTGGYSNDWEFSAEAADRTWGERVRRRFYVRVRDGRIYGWVSVDIFARYGDDDDSGTFGIEYAVNPNRSRILRQ